MLGGESFFVNTYPSGQGPGELTVAPSLPGDIVHIPLRGETLIVQSGSYIASSEQIEVDSKWGGAKAIHEMEIPDGQEYVVDTGHIVAFGEGVQYQVRKVGGWKSTLLSGEGLVTAFRGPGKVFLQTRSPNTFISWLANLLPKPSS
jgi:uncharacterized protein (AIM24 family)